MPAVAPTAQRPAPAQGSPARPTPQPPHAPALAPAAPPPPVPSVAAPPVAARVPAAPAGPAARPPAARPPPAASRFGLSIIAGTARGQRFKLPVGACNVGRARGAILFSDDIFLSPLHATFLVRDSALFIKDESSASGVFVTISGTEIIAPMAFFSAGQRLFRFNGRLEPQPPLPGRPVSYGAPLPTGHAVYGVEEILVGGRGGRAVVTAAPLLTIGQARCDLSYPQDEGLAARHCELSLSPQGAQLRDLSGGLGTYVRLPPMAERPLRPGDRVRLGQHLLQVELLG